MAASRMGIRELRDTLTATMRRVRAGETIEVTHHGEPIATLAPVVADRLRRLVESGEVTLGVSSPVEGEGRRFPVTGERSASQALGDDRSER